MHFLDQAKTAITIKYIDGLAREARPRSPDAIVKNLLAAAAELLLDVANEFDDKTSLVAAFFKMIGLQHIQFVAESGVLPAIDDQANDMLYNALLSTLRAHLAADLDGAMKSE